MPQWKGRLFQKLKKSQQTCKYLPTECISSAEIFYEPMTLSVTFYVNVLLLNRTAMENAGLCD